jgi:serpin B
LACIAATPAVDRDQSSPEKMQAKGNNAFAINMYQQLHADEGNLFFSPYSIRTALAMTSVGARGRTAEQMKTALSFTLEYTELHKAFAESINALNSGDGDNYEMNVANSLWGDTSHKFLPSFINVNKQTYGGKLEQVDFINAPESARIKINTWVEEQTRQKIKNLIPPGGVNANTRLALVNAVYFKGLWTEQFDKKLTRNLPFYGTGDRVTEAPLMTFSKPMSLPFFAEDGIKIIELDYRGKDISMVVLLPDTADGLAAIETSLNEGLLSRWMGSLKKQMVSVHLPRFSMTWGAKNLVPALRQLGMPEAFIKGAADFSGIDGTRELLITSVFHKAFVDVHEEGTEAAAATGVMVGVTSMPPPPEIFRADHPFLFLIREKATGSILFMGRLTEPLTTIGALKD